MEYKRLPTKTKRWKRKKIVKGYVKPRRWAQCVFAPCHEMKKQQRPPDPLVLRAWDVTGKGLKETNALQIRTGG